MTEPIEKWKEEFEAFFDAHTNKNCGVAYYMGVDGKYCFSDIELAWQSFLAAKRSRPVVELPNAKHIFFDTKLQEKGFVSAIEYVGEILDDAGINYRIKGK